MQCNKINWFSIFIDYIYKIVNSNSFIVKEIFNQDWISPDKSRFHFTLTFKTDEINPYFRTKICKVTQTVTMLHYRVSLRCGYRRLLGKTGIGLELSHHRNANCVEHSIEHKWPRSSLWIYYFWYVCNKNSKYLITCMMITNLISEIRLQPFWSPNHQRGSKSAKSILPFWRHFFNVGNK